MSDEAGSAVRAQLGWVIRQDVDKAGPAATDGEEFIYVDISSIDRDSKKITDAKKIATSSAPSRAKQRLQTGDVLVSMTRPNLNAVAMVPRELDGAIGSTGFHVIRTEHVDSRFVFYLTQTRDFIESLSQRVQGALYPAVRPADIDSFEFLLPPTAEQVRIVAKLDELFSELDQGVENLRTAQQQLKVYRQALLKHAFEGKLTAEWRAQNPDKLECAEALLARIQQERKARQQQLTEWQEARQAWEANGKSGSKPAKPKAPKVLPPLTTKELAELPGLPAGWAWMKIHQLCEVVRGGSPRPAGDPKFYDGNIPFLKVADLTKGSSPYLTSYTYTIKEAGLNKTRQIKPNTLLLTNSGATLGVPKICLISATMNDGVAAFLGLPQDQLLYHYYFWQSQTERLRNIDQGAAQPNLNTDLIKETPIPVCSPVEQATLTQTIEAALSGADQLEQTITTSLQQAEALRQSILKKAFSGQLVPQHPDDEPASVLLERIRAERAAQQPATRRGRQRRAEA
ncbi:restriction endonuclease subunit S [Thauera aromatica]|uniref:restriction endonuclease subunit S n=1 Tax=Thauera aromatica TaxID=59405 RepID=UPI001FFDDAC0|nr:restriction endonuclease subunit S [Thauera aromatica]MCK2088956.1 restriction endonuclease subunit S [Thauera aromatica]